MIKAIVTDIEGTTSSIRFVHDVLFPYAHEHIAEYVRTHSGESGVKAQIEAVCQEAGKELDLDGVITQLKRWIDEDKKITSLKALQGMIWESGYKNGDFKGHIYPDAKEYLERWHEHGIALYVYSSGSVYAQKLLFGYTEYGDLNSLFSGNFDTQIGAKVEAESYRTIVRDLKLAPEQILFLSDIEKELDAAREAGMQTCWLVRDDAPDSSASHQQVSDFSQIEF
ncbi:MAG: acireductone synthase [Gammaproteobacteria bacterium]|nr:acireductone synthase [Gammaproteobacteria bacterium]MDH5594126.1 acireductone synthase [Gammaproteobacteria bacterium]MDH5613827.1 acireductone synthase [Gammaproteobacteria bacterium]